MSSKRAAITRQLRSSGSKVFPLALGCTGMSGMTDMLTRTRVSPGCRLHSSGRLWIEPDRAENPPKVCPPRVMVREPSAGLWVDQASSRSVLERHYAPLSFLHVILSRVSGRRSEDDGPRLAIGPAANGL
jgi:hypothetical protein